MPQRVVIITGASGGLGSALVQEFATQGWLVAAGYHSQNLHSETATLYPVALDITIASDCERVIRDVLGKWGRVDVLINNAGLTSDEAFWQMADDAWERIISVNLKGAFLCARVVAGPMSQQGSGHIINVGSFSGRSGAKGQTSYSAAKAGLIGLTGSLARELGPRNVRVNTVLPGVLPTRMTTSLPPKQLAQFAHANALGRINSLAEVARFLVFLAAMENVSGQVFQLDSRITPWA